jgi:hypothetical protein
MLSGRKSIIPFLLFVLFPAVMLLGGCAPQVGSEAAETEIAGFMLDHILSEQIGDASPVVEAIDKPWVQVPLDAKLIVWAPPAPDFGEQTTTSFLDTSQPIKVWRYVDGQISEAADRTGAIRQYREALIQSPASGSWGYYEFGILSVSRGSDEATVYLGISCGPLCGEGLVYTLNRSESGGWEIIHTDPRWIS